MQMKGMMWDAEVVATLTRIKPSLELICSVSVFTWLRITCCSIFFCSKTRSCMVQGVHVQQQFRKECTLKLSVTWQLLKTCLIHVAVASLGSAKQGAVGTQ